jgi:hypothetical protein
VILLPQCEHCGKEVFLSFQCRECYGFFCEECQPPHVHRCQRLEVQKNEVKPESHSETNHILKAGIEEITETGSRENKDGVTEATQESQDMSIPERSETTSEKTISEVQKVENPGSTAVTESESVKEPKVAKETILTIFIMLLISVSLLGGIKFGYLSSPYLEDDKISYNGESSHTAVIETTQVSQTPNPTPTPDITENLIIMLESYGFFAIQDFDGIRLSIKFENKNSNPLKVYVMQARTGSGVFMFNDDRKLKRPLDEFNITSSGAISREYFIPKLKLQEIEGDMLTIEMEVVYGSAVKRIVSSLEMEKGKTAETQPII